MLENDVAAIDINMGCPKDYSIKGGMGAALLTKPEEIKEILTTLTKNLSIPVTCKIRILPNLEDTLTLVKLIESTGVAALTVHGRTPAERPRHMNHDDVIRAISKSVTIPVIANGGSKNTINLHEDIEFFRQQTGASSVMIARAAMWYPAIFHDFTNGKTPPALHDLIREYLQLAIRWDHNISGTKYCIQQMLHREGTTDLYLDTIAARDLKEMSTVWGMHDVYMAELEQRSKPQLHTKRQHSSSPLRTSPLSFEDPKRLKTDDFDLPSSNGPPDPLRLSIPYERRYWPPLGPTPKQLLQEYCKKHRFRSLDFTTHEVREARLFYGTVSFNDRKYENTFGCKSKKCAEQASALVCLQALGLPNGKMDTTYPMQTNNCL